MVSDHLARSDHLLFFPEMLHQVSIVLHEDLQQVQKVILGNIFFVVEVAHSFFNTVLISVQLLMSVIHELQSICRKLHLSDGLGEHSPLFDLDVATKSLNALVKPGE